MTQFNSAAVLMGLDEYYEHCVDPKPHIPKRYSSDVQLVNKKRNRKAGHLQSYKDRDSFGEEDEEEDDRDAVFPSSSNSNNKQLNYEMNQFNLLYDSENQTNISNNQSCIQVKQGLTSFDSAQSRIQQYNNVNRPLGGGSLVPKNMSRNNTKPYLPDNRGQKYQNGRFERGKPFKYYYRNGNGNNNIGGCPEQFGQSRRRFGNENNFQRQLQQYQHLPNMLRHDDNQQMPRNYGHEAVRNDRYDRVKSQANEWNFGNESGNIRSKGWNDPNSFTNLVNVVNNIKISNVSPSAARLMINAPTPPNVSRDKEAQAMNKAENKNPVQLNSLPRTTLRLADLLNMDKESCKNINTNEVAKNAILLLRTVMQSKPDENGQINLDATDLSPFHRSQ